ncbi:MAG: CopD family protein [Bacteroidetes bacterium]|nr:CopD family protein [Bacteroidota bacterium]
MEYYRYVMSMHIIFMVCWFAALFYMPRLLIYHVEATLKPEPDKSILSDQLKIMQRRLWNAISWPSMILTFIFGTWMLVLNWGLLIQPWFILKLVFVFLLSLYHLQTHFIFKKQQRDEIKWNSFTLRMWNEVATIFLFAIIFLVVPPLNSGWVWAALGLVLFILAIFSAVAIYKANREKKEEVSPIEKDSTSPPTLP